MSRAPAVAALLVKRRTLFQFVLSAPVSAILAFATVSNARLHSNDDDDDLTSTCHGVGL